MTIKDLIENKYNSTAELVACLQSKDIIAKVEPTTERIYILDTTNPKRHKSREFEVREDANGLLYLKEM